MQTVTDIGKFAALNLGPEHRKALEKLLAEYEGLFRHDGYGTLRVEMRFLKKGQKEVLINCGKEYRFVIDYPGDFAR